jgi:putative hydrolase of the HAD superfamily
MNDERAALAGIIRRCSVPLKPSPPPSLPPGWEIPADAGTPRAVLFDVYGTLFCSAAGDIGGGEYAGAAGAGEAGAAADGPEGPDGAGVAGAAADGPDGAGEAGAAADGPDVAGEAGAAADGALDALAREYAPGLAGTDLRVYFQEGVREVHRQLAAKTPFPELRVEELWARFLRDRGTGGADTGDLSRRARELALRYELAVNPVWPMPGAEAAVRCLAGASIVLGVISNAQFYTPLLFDAFFGCSPEEIGFCPDLLIYSFEMGEAKPAKGLFARARDRLADRGVKPEECLYVGNDMLKDIHGAASLGFMTALFAGDGRSLRLRAGDERIRGLRPTRIIRRLAELLPPGMSPPV